MTERVTSGLSGGGWKRIYGGASEAPSNERDGTDRLHLRSTAPVLDPTCPVPLKTTWARFGSREDI